MKNQAVFALCLGSVVAVSICSAADLKQSKITQVVNDVRIISAASQAQTPAAVNEIFKMPDQLHTGPASRAELVASDNTVTRVGANTIFSFDPANRTIDLKEGSLLFHAPHGKGGGTIHTGSATASVLGTTLIVTTTPNGGMKVIDLEGSVEVNFLNGLKQHLAPGQMTFILPGGKQLAPIIIFRLDELTKNSLLVKGFNQPLASLPLIQNQVENQMKLIKSGRATDTGLLVGNNASPNQVEVLDPATIQSSVGSATVQNALQADATLTTSSLTDPNIPTPPNRIFLDPAFSLPGNSFFAGQTFRGFAAQNISFNSASTLTLDMSPYAINPVFDFVAANNVSFAGSVTFGGLSTQNQLEVIGGGQITFAPNINLEADCGNFLITSPGALTMNGGSLGNTLGQVGLISGSSITLNNVNVFPHDLLTLAAPDAINVTYASNGQLGRFGLTDYNTLITDPSHGEVTVSAQGSLTVNSTSIQAHFLTLNSGDSILLDASGQTLMATGSGATANLTAPNLITVNNANLTSFPKVNMSAHTITLNNVQLAAGSTDNFGTHTGQVSVNSTQIPGGLNLLNTSYGGTAITSVGQVNLSSGPGTTPGIYSFANGK